jgi:hypothetical protein
LAEIALPLTSTKLIGTVIDFVATLGTRFGVVHPVIMSATANTIDEVALMGRRRANVGRANLSLGPVVDSPEVIMFPFRIALPATIGSRMQL